MAAIKRTERDGEQTFTINHDEGLNAFDLLTLLERLRQHVGDDGLKCMPLALCVEGIDSYTTRLVEVNNEGDMSHLWFSLDRDAHAACQTGLDG
jgi:hypothetical protein